MTSIVKALFVFPIVGFNSKCKPPIWARGLGSGNLTLLPSKLGGVHRTDLVWKTGRIRCLSDVKKMSVGSSIRVDKKENCISLDKLEPLWDDGYGTQSANDFLERAKDMIIPDGGPLRWFCPVECGCPVKDSPVLLYLPGNQLSLVQILKKQKSL